MSKFLASAFIGVLIVALAGGATRGLADTATYPAWQFSPAGQVLTMVTIKDLSRDSVDDVIVAAADKSIYALDGATGAKLWNYTAQEYHTWSAVVASPPTDVNDNSNSDVLVATKDRLVMMLDGAKGKRLWSFNTTTTAADSGSYQQGTACSLSVRSAYYVSDIDGDGIADAAVISGTGDSCTQKDRVSILALSGKTGQQLWEYAKAEDYHGLKDGTKNASPVAILDYNKDGTKDIVFADEQSFLRVINGRDGTELDRTELDVFGSIWDFTEIPDISGDGIADVVALEFIEAGGGPDYAAIDAIDLRGSKVIWQVKVGDGRVDGGAVFSAASLSGVGANLNDVLPRIAVTQRLENKLSLVLLDSKTGEQKWQYALGEERSRDDLNKIYPVARIATTGARDELAVGSIDSKLYLLNPADASVIWSYGVTGEIGGMAFAVAPGGQNYIMVEESYHGVTALSRQTTISTTLSIQPSAETVVASSKVVISGALTPSFPGKLIEIRYVDPKGAVTTRPLILSKDGTYSDVFEPEMTGDWKVNVAFDGEGFYLDSTSRTISIKVIDEEKILVYMLKVPDDESVSYPIPYFVDGGQVNDMSINKETKTLKIAINPSKEDGSLEIDLPRNVIDAFDKDYQVLINGKQAQYQEIESEDSSTRSLSIPFKQDSSEITISGTYIVPEFSIVGPLLFAVVMLAVLATSMVMMRARRRLY